jgi:hypothetical protein
MRFESPGLLGFFKAIAPLAGILLLMFLVKMDYDEIVYRLGRADWLYVAIGAAFFLALLSVPAFRLFKEYRTWKVLCLPFHIVQDPFIDVDLKEESYGDVFLDGGYRIKRAATFASRGGVIVRKAAYPKLFPTFEIGWDAITHILFIAAGTDCRFGSDPYGVARITLGLAEEFVLVLPWRGDFNTHIPDRIGLRNENFVGKDTKG